MFNYPIRTWLDFEKDYEFMEYCKNLNWNSEEIYKVKEDCETMKQNRPKNKTEMFNLVYDEMIEKGYFCADYWEKKLNETEST